MIAVDAAPVLFGGEAYLPVNIGSVRVGSKPDFALYFRPGPGQPFVLYCERNVAFTGDAQSRLEQSGVDRLFIQKRHRGQYARYLAEHLEDILADPALPPEEKAGILYDSAESVVEEVFENPKSEENVQRGKDIVRQTVTFMTGGSFVLEHMLRAISCDYYLYTHSVNVVAYSIALCLQAGFRDAATLREVANGALLHDLGKSALPPELLNKPEELEPEECELVRQHPNVGHSLLQETATLGEIALDIVQHHHERLDGSGYPEGLDGGALSPFVRIVAIADVFDALTTDRFHQKAASTFAALGTMKTSMQEQLDAALLADFIRILSGKPSTSG